MKTDLVYMVPQRRPPLSLCPRNCCRCGWRRCILREHHDKTDGLCSTPESKDLGVSCKCAVTARGCDCAAHQPHDEHMDENKSAVKDDGGVDADDGEEADNREATQLENKLYVLLTAKPKAYPSSSSDGGQNVLDEEMVDTLSDDDEVSRFFPKGRAQWSASPSPFSEVEEDCSKKSRFSGEADNACSKKPRLSEDLISTKLDDSYWV